MSNAHQDRQTGAVDGRNKTVAEFFGGLECSAHLRRSSSSLRSASSPARLICAAPAHRFALHRHRRDSSAPLLLIASLCIVTGATHLRRS
ncbi:hypothetical protein EUA95_12685, partial [Mycobacterium tuberculosis]